MFFARTKPALSLALSALLSTPLLAADAPAAPGPPAAPLSAFVVAHPDDWQLFMGDVAVARVAAGGPVVFVYLTAGGADRAADYWQAREAGSAASVDAAASRGDGAPPETRRDACRAASVVGHRIQRCAYRNTVSYYLRLPDGAYDGKGFAASGFQSLERFAGGDIERIEAVDASAAYRGWADLRHTVGTLLAGEMDRATAGAIELHSHDPDPEGNPGDHSDHRSAARLAAELAAGRQPAIIDHLGYAGYAVSRRPANLSSAQAAAKMLVFMRYERQRLLANAQWSAYAEEPAAYSSWLFRTYRRHLAVAAPCLPDCMP